MHEDVSFAATFYSQLIRANSCTLLTHMLRNVVLWGDGQSCSAAADVQHGCEQLRVPA
jgi:hypothetical protein